MCCPRTTQRMPCLPSAPPAPPCPSVPPSRPPCAPQTPPPWSWLRTPAPRPPRRQKARRRRGRALPRYFTWGRRPCWLRCVRPAQPLLVRWAMAPPGCMLAVRHLKDMTLCCQVANGGGCAPHFAGARPGGDGRRAARGAAAGARHPRDPQRRHCTFQVGRASERAARAGPIRTLSKSAGVWPAHPCHAARQHICQSRRSLPLASSSMGALHPAETHLAKPHTLLHPPPLQGPRRGHPAHIIPFATADMVRCTDPREHG
jgi:hypothetical protein